MHLRLTLAKSYGVHGGGTRVSSPYKSQSRFRLSLRKAEYERKKSCNFLNELFSTLLKIATIILIESFVLLGVFHALFSDTSGLCMTLSISRNLQNFCAVHNFQHFPFLAIFTASSDFSKHYIHFFR